MVWLEILQIVIGWLIFAATLYIGIALTNYARTYERWQEEERGTYFVDLLQVTPLYAGYAIGICGAACGGLMIEGAKLRRKVIQLEARMEQLESHRPPAP